jgi:hypothetical protein
MGNFFYINDIFNNPKLLEQYLKIQNFSILVQSIILIVKYLSLLKEKKFGSSHITVVVNYK